MPISYEIDRHAGVITITLSGRLTPSDVTEYLAASREDAAFRPTMHRLVLIDSVESYPDSTAVREVTARTRADSPTPLVRIAVVAATPIDRGMAAMFFGLWGVSDRYHLFDDVSSARKWLATGTT